MTGTPIERHHDAPRLDQLRRRLRPVLLRRTKPRVERAVSYVRSNFFRGETFVDLEDVWRRSRRWCTETAGLRIHGTTCCRPIEAFRAVEQAALLSAPAEPFDVPRWSSPRVHRAFHVEVARSLYSAPHPLLGERLRARADSKSVKLYFRGELVRIHPRVAPGRRSTKPEDLPKGTEVYATRDLDALRERAFREGPAIGAYAAGILDTPLPWNRMRQVYRLLGLVKKWGPTRVDQACGKALETEILDVTLIGRMLERARETAEAGVSGPTPVLPARFARRPEEFATAAGKQ